MIKNREKCFHPTICVTQRCNLNCVYCYQHHDSSRLSFQTAKKCIDDIFSTCSSEYDEIEIAFIGGEPLLEFDLLKQIFDYTNSQDFSKRYYFFATTNGTLLNQEMKDWFSKNKSRFVLGLSLDGTPETHNHNRSNSFSKIDIEFFKKNWPFQGVKMTLTDFSLEHFAENIKYIHSLGINQISGVNLFEGTFDWNQDKYIKILIPQLEELVNFYVENDNLQLNQMFNKKILRCESKKREMKKYCGIGTGAVFYDVNGIKRACSYCTPMTFSETELEIIGKTDFSNEENFVDEECFNNCYIYPICPHCAGANFLAKKTFKVWDKSKCRIQKLIAIYIADLLAKRMLKNPASFSNSEKIHNINAIKKIKELFVPEFSEYFKS